MNKTIYIRKDQESTWDSAKQLALIDESELSQVIIGMLNKYIQEHRMCMACNVPLNPNHKFCPSCGGASSFKAVSG